MSPTIPMIWIYFFACIGALISWCFVMQHLSKTFMVILVPIFLNYFGLVSIDPGKLWNDTLTHGIAAGISMNPVNFPVLFVVTLGVVYAACYDWAAYRHFHRRGNTTKASAVPSSGKSDKPKS